MWILWDRETTNANLKIMQFCKSHIQWPNIAGWNIPILHKKNIFKSGSVFRASHVGLPEFPKKNQAKTLWKLVLVLFFFLGLAVTKNQHAPPTSTTRFDNELFQPEPKHNRKKVSNLMHQQHNQPLAPYGNKTRQIFLPRFEVGAAKALKAQKEACSWVCISILQNLSRKNTIDTKPGVNCIKTLIISAINLILNWGGWKNILSQMVVKNGDLPW